MDGFVNAYAHNLRFTFDTTDQGSFTIDYFSVGKNKELDKKCNNYEGVSAGDLVNHLFNILVMLRDDEDQKKEYILSDEDKDRFAEEFLSRNEWLTTELVRSENEESESGLIRVNRIEEKIDIPTEYDNAKKKLLFLFRRKHDDEVKRFKRMYPFLDFKMPVTEMDSFKSFNTGSLLNREVSDSFNRLGALNDKFSKAVGSILTPEVRKIISERASAQGYPKGSEQAEALFDTITNLSTTVAEMNSEMRTLSGATADRNNALIRAQNQATARVLSRLKKMARVSKRSGCVSIFIALALFLVSFLVSLSFNNGTSKKIDTLKKSNEQIMNEIKSNVETQGKHLGEMLELMSETNDSIKILSQKVRFSAATMG